MELRFGVGAGVGKEHRVPVRNWTNSSSSRIFDSDLAMICGVYLRMDCNNVHRLSFAFHAIRDV